VKLQPEGDKILQACNALVGIWSLGSLMHSPPASAPESPPDDRLNSWKEIAAYLKRDVRTLHRWEMEEGLPIHRHHHKQRGSVYAYRSELEAWWNERRLSIDKQENTLPSTGNWRRLCFAATFLILLFAACVYLLQRRAGDHIGVPERKIRLAVLPFENLGGDPEQEYFSDGLTEEMIARLAGLNPQQLAVIARSSSMRYKHSSQGVTQIGRDLGVDYLLAGTVRREGSTVRVTAELVQVRDQTHLWSHSYQREQRDLSALQGDLAQAVAREIQVMLTPSQETRLALAHPATPEAHEAYLKGLYFWNKMTEGSHQLFPGSHQAGSRLRRGLCELGLLLRHTGPLYCSTSH
jgi:TolB-like protein